MKLIEPSFPFIGSKEVNEDRDWLIYKGSVSFFALSTNDIAPALIEAALYI